MYSYSPLTLEESNLPVWKVLLGILLPSLIFFIAIDICWIAFVVGSAFQQAHAGLMRPTPDPVAGLLAGMIIVGGVLFFVTLKARTKAQALTQVWFCDPLGLEQGTGLDAAVFLRPSRPGPRHRP